MRNPFRKRIPILPICPDDLEDQWVTIHVKFHHPMHDVDDPAEPPAQGYYQVLGIRMQPEIVRDYLVRFVSDGNIIWHDTEWHAVDPSKLKRDIQEQFKPIQGQGVWFLSGRVCYADTEPSLADEENPRESPPARPN